MSWIVRDENGGDRVVAPWPNVSAEDMERARQFTEMLGPNPLELNPRNEPTGWDRLPVPLPRTESGYDPFDFAPDPNYDPNAPVPPEMKGRYEPTMEARWDYWGGVPEGPITWPGGGVPRDLGDQSQRIPVIPYSEEANRNELGFLGKFVEMMKRTGGKLMDKYQQNEAEKKEWRENNPGGYPGMPQHLRERLRRNQMSSIDGQLVAGYDPELDQYMYDEHGPVVGTPSQEFLDRPKIFGSDVLDMLIENEQVKNPSRSNNGWA